MSVPEPVYCALFGVQIDLSELLAAAQGGQEADNE